MHRLRLRLRLLKGHIFVNILSQDSEYVCEQGWWNRGPKKKKETREKQERFKKKERALSSKPKGIFTYQKVTFAPKRAFYPQKGTFSVFETKRHLLVQKSHYHPEKGQFKAAKMPLSRPKVTIFYFLFSICFRKVF